MRHLPGVLLLALLGATLCGPAAAETEEKLLERARRIHESAIVIDGHNDVTSFILDYDYDYDLGMDGADPNKRDATLFWIHFSENFIDPDKAGVWPSVRYWFSHLGWQDTPLDVLVDHFEHATRVAGIDYVGLGSDFDGVLFLPEGMKDVSSFPNLTRELLRRGHSEADVRKVLGENLLRVMAEAEAVAEER